MILGLFALLAFVFNPYFWVLPKLCRKSVRKSTLITGAVFSLCFALFWIYSLNVLSNIPDLSQYTISEECLFTLEERIGLVNFNKKANQVIASASTLNPFLFPIPGTEYHVSEKEKVFAMVFRRTFDSTYSIILLSKYASLDSPDSIRWKPGLLFRVDSFIDGGPSAGLLFLHALIIYLPLLFALLALKRAGTSFPALITLIFALTAGTLLLATQGQFFESAPATEEIKAQVTGIPADTLNQISFGKTAILPQETPPAIACKKILCGGTDFFERPFQCRHLGNFSYLYYAPDGLPERFLTEKGTKIEQLTPDFTLVRYPGFADFVKANLVSHYLNAVVILLIFAAICVHSRRKNAPVPPPGNANSTEACKSCSTA